MIFTAYILLLLMWAVVGLIGGGGAILTVPILTYLFHIDVILATYYSLVIVGSVALAGAIIKLRTGEILWKAVAVFGAPSVLATYFARQFIIPHLPHEIAGVSLGVGLLIVFSLIMLGSGCSMACRRYIDSFDTKTATTPHPSYIRMGIIWVFIGTLAGLVGAGGGFLIVPALTLLEGYPVRSALATSLVLIAINSLIGSLGDISNPAIQSDPRFLSAAIITALIWLGIGLFFQKRFDSKLLSRGFGILTIAMGVMIFLKEIF